jgi:hypothetical protein
MLPKKRGRPKKVTKDKKVNNLQTIQNGGLNRVLKILMDHRLNQILREAEDMKTKKELFLTKVKEKEKKYRALVWYYRCRIETVNPCSALCGAEVESTYPLEVKRLKDDTTGWEHGFNCGCLAIFRYLDDLDEYLYLNALERSQFHDDDHWNEPDQYQAISVETETARIESEFPNLDT